MNKAAQSLSVNELDARIDQLLNISMSVIDEARAYREIITLTDLTQAQLANRLNCSQATIANKLRLLKLGDVALAAIESGQMTERHGRTILKLDKRKQASVVTKILKQALTVKQTEVLVQEIVDNQLDLPTQQTMLRDFLNQGIQRLAKQGVFIEQIEAEGAITLKIIDKNQERKA